MEIDRKARLSGISIAVLLLTAFVLVQPILQITYAQVSEESAPVEIEGVPSFQNCDDQLLVDVSMDTVRSKDVILTTHSEKEIFECFTVQGNIEVLVEVTIVTQLYENVTTKDIIKKQVDVITCVRDPTLAETYGCKIDRPLDDVIPRLDCIADEIRKNQNSISKGKNVKTIEAQKMVYLCDLDGFVLDRNNLPLPCTISGPGTNSTCFDPEKKVDEVIFVETWKDTSKLPNDPIVKTTFESVRCVVLLSNAKVESCIFTNLGGA